MLEYKRSLKARKLDASQLSPEIKEKISELAKLEKNLIDAEKEGNTELVETLNDQFIDLDSAIADMIDDYEAPKKEDKKDENKEEVKEESKEPEAEKGNSNIALGLLGLAGAVIAGVFLLGKKK